MSDPRTDRPCFWCGAILKFDGWDMVHPSGLGEGSDGKDEPHGNPQHPYWRKTFTSRSSEAIR